MQAEKVLSPKGTYLSGKRPALENILPRMIFTPKGSSLPESTASSHSFPLAVSCSFLHMLNPNLQALLEIEDQYLTVLQKVNIERKENQI